MSKITPYTPLLPLQILGGVLTRLWNFLKAILAKLGDQFIRCLLIAPERVKVIRAQPTEEDQFFVPEGTMVDEFQDCIQYTNEEWKQLTTPQTEPSAGDSLDDKPWIQTRTVPFQDEIGELLKLVENIELMPIKKSYDNLKEKGITPFLFLATALAKSELRERTRTIIKNYSEANFISLEYPLFKLGKHNLVSFMGKYFSEHPEDPDFENFKEALDQIVPAKNGAMPLSTRLEHLKQRHDRGALPSADDWIAFFKDLFEVEKT